MNWIKNSLILFILNFILIDAINSLENSTIVNNNTNKTKNNEIVYIRPASFDIGKQGKNDNNDNNDDDHDDEDFQNALLKALSEVSDDKMNEEITLEMKLTKKNNGTDDNNGDSFSNNVAVFTSTHMESKTEEPLNFFSKIVDSSPILTPKSSELVTRKVTTTTAAPLEVKTEENEAKVEQVQFFSAPLVAAFTVHQNELGHAQKVEPIFKNNLVYTEAEKTYKPQTRPRNDIQQKQRLLEQELESLRKQQTFLEENIRNNIASSSNNIPTTNLDFTHQQLLQKGFNQGKTENLKLLEPVFSEPDRSVITKLVAVDPDKLIDQNIITMLNNPLGNSLNLPGKTTQSISVIPSVTFKPQPSVSVDSSLSNNRGNLDTSSPPLILPNLRKSVEFRKTVTSNFKVPLNNFNVDSLPFRQTEVNPAAIKQVYFKYTGGASPVNYDFNNNFKTLEQNIINKRNPQFGDQLSSLSLPLQQQSNRFRNNFNENSNFPRSTIENQHNRFLRHEQNTGNLGINQQQNTFSIQPAIQSYFPQEFKLDFNNNEISLAPPRINSFNRDFYNVYNNRFL